MVMSPQEAKQKAILSTASAAEEQLAILLKKNLGNMTVKFPGLEVPANTPEGDKEYLRMARELIDKQEFTSGVRVTIKQLDADPDIHKIATDRGAKSLESLIPNRTQLNAIGEAVGDGVESQTGTIGFLGGATIWNALVGLVQWFLGGMEGGWDGLKNTITQITANQMEQSVANNLQQLRSERPDMWNLLSDSAIASAGTQVRQAVQEQAAGNDATTPAFSNLRNAVPEEFPVQQARAKIRDAVLKPEGGPPLAESIYSTYKATVKDKLKNAEEEGVNFFGLGKIPGSGTVASTVGKVMLAPDEQRMRFTSTKMADIIADSIANTVTDSKFVSDNGNGKPLGQLTQEEFSKAVAAQVAKDVKAREKELGLPPGQSLDEKALKSITDTIAEKIKGNGQLHAVAKKVYGDAQRLAEAKFRNGHNPADTEPNKPQAPLTHLARIDPPSTGLGQ